MSGPTEESEYLHLTLSHSVAEAPSFQAGLEDALRDVCEWTDWVIGQAWVPTGEGYVEQLPVSYVEDEAFERFVDISSDYTFGPGEGIPGRVLESHDPVWFPDVSAVSDDIYPRTAAADEIGLQAGLGVPVLADGELIVVLEFYLAERRDVDEELVEKVSGVAGELGALVARKQAEGALDRERDLLEQMMEAAPVGIFVFSRDGDLERANARAIALHDLDEPGSLHATDRTFYTDAGDPVPAAEQPFTNVRDAGRPVRDWVARIDTVDGNRRWLSVNAAPILDDDGSVERVVITEKDITRLKEQARRLKQQRDELRTELDEMFSRIDDAFFGLDTDWRFAYVNERAEELLQRPREELYGERFWEAFPEAAETDEVRNAFYSAMETQESTRFERYCDTLGFWIGMAIYPSDTGLSVTFRDISDRKLRERQLEQYRAVTAAANDVIVTIDEASTIQAINPAVEDVFGYGAADLVGQSLTTLMPDRLTDGHRRGIVRYLETGERNIDWDYVELPGEHADGTEKTLAISFSEVEFEGERLFTGVIRDIAERKQMERRLEESNERLEQFAYAASHDLQEPLRMVTSYLQLLERRYGDVLDDDAQEFLDFAVDGAERMRNMIDALLEYSRVETRGDPFEPVALEDVLEDVLADLHLQIEESGAEITAESLPVVEGDSDQLRQVFQNLLENAIEYSGDEPPRVHVSAERVGETWELAVEDAGIGIDTDHQERIFEVFQRLHTQGEHEGIGIGLALCQRIVERHGGDIWVESEPVEGTTFYFTLPPAADR